MSRPAASSGDSGVTPARCSGPSFALNIGTISINPPIEIAIAVSTAIVPPRASMTRR